MAEIKIVKNIREENQKIAKENAERFRSSNVFVMNIMSSPGAGKTTLLEKTLVYLSKKWRLAVIEGDLQTTKDADRISALGIPVHQINTQEGCHLDARMIQEALGSFNLDEIDIMFIENVGNLVCPASFELGEHKKIVLLSIPEGSDKPIKYPKMFHQSNVVLLTKTDLLEYCNFDLKQAQEDIRQINPNALVFQVSCRKEIGLENWYRWIEENCLLQKKKTSRKKDATTLRCKENQTNRRAKTDKKLENQIDKKQVVETKEKQTGKKRKKT